MNNYIKLKCLISLLFLLLFIACNQSDQVIDLGDRYQFTEESKGSRFVTGDYNIPSNVISYGYDNQYILVSQIPDKQAYKIFISTDLMNRYLIYSNSIKDKTFLQRNNSGNEEIKIRNDSGIYQLFIREGISANNSQQDIVKSDRIADSILEHDFFYKKVFSNSTNYWIIAKKSKQLYGPLTQHEFLQKRKELKVPDNLKLESTE